MTCILGKPFSCDCSITSCLLLFLSVDCETCDYTISTSEEAPPDYTPAQRFPVCKLQTHTHWHSNDTTLTLHTHTHTTHTDRHSHTHTDRQTHWHRQTHWQTDNDRHTHWQTHTLTDRHTDRQADTHTLTDWQTDRHTHIDMLQTYTDRHTHTHTNRQTDIQTHWQTGRLTKPSTIRSRPVIPIAYCLNTSPPVHYERAGQESDKALIPYCGTQLIIIMSFGYCVNVKFLSEHFDAHAVRYKFKFWVVQCIIVHSGGSNFRGLVNGVLTVCKICGW